MAMSYAQKTQASSPTEEARAHVAGGSPQRRTRRKKRGQGRSWIDDPNEIVRWLGGGGEETGGGKEDPYLDQNDNETEIVGDGAGEGSSKGGSSQCVPTSTAMVISAELGIDGMQRVAEGLWADRGKPVAPGTFSDATPEHLVWEYTYLRTEEQWREIVGHEFSCEIHKYSSVMAHILEEFLDRPASVLPSGVDGLKQIEHFPVVASTNLTGSGHVVVVTEVSDTGVRVDDPYGAKTEDGYLVNGKSGEAPPAHRWAENPALQGVDTSKPRSDWGNDNLFTWEEVEAWDIGKWISGVKGP